MVDIVKLDKFDKFDKLLWISNTLNDYEKLTSGNLKMILGKGFFEIIEKYELYLQEIIELANLIEKKDKKHYIEKKDWAEKIISNIDIDILSDEYGYKEFIEETKGSYISIKNAIQELLKNYNIEGHKKVYDKKPRDLHELQELINSNKYYKTNNVESVTNIFNEIVKLLKDVEYIEKEEKNIYKINTHNEWEEFYKNHLYDLQYRLSKIRHLDNENLIETNRYSQLDIRLSKTLNRYREKFADLLEENYSTWKKQEYGISRPILNSDISDFIDLENNKNFILIFDGMRYDAWKYIVSPYFKEIFKNKEVNYKSSFALLPSITSISRETIYSDIIKEHRKDTAILTKSESVKNQNEIKEIILEDKKNNIFIFNMFDRDGHRATEDFYIFYDKQRKVFEDTIKELLGLIPKYGNIIIASDHGLMRIDKYLNLREEDNIYSIKSRYAKGREESTLENSIKLSNIGDLGDEEKYLLSYSNRGYFIGGGERDFYSHGGASLEEVILPFIIVEGVYKNELLDSNQKHTIKNKDRDIIEKIKFDDGFILNLGFKVNDKEKLILKTLYNLKNQTITTQDIELKLVRELGSAGMTNSIINRLIRKLKKEDLDIIEVSSAGDIILYKFKHNELKGAK